MALSQPPPLSLKSSEDAQDASSISRETKRRRFHPLRAVRNIFRRRLRRVESEELQQSSKKSRSTTELIEPLKNEEKARFPPVAKAPYAVGLSVSHDSIFSPDPSTISVDLAQHCADFKSELMARIHARRSSEEDDDVGLPHSPCTSPTTAEVLAHNHKSTGSSKLTTTCSAGSLLSMGSSENDEDIFGALSQNASRSSHHPENLSSSSVSEEAASPMPLSHSAAHHKIAVRPKRNHGKPHQRKWQGQMNLPSTPEVCEVSLPGSSMASADSRLDLSDSQVQKPGETTPKKSNEGKKGAKEDSSKGVFSIFSSRTKKSSEPGELCKGSSPPSEGPFFSRLFGSRRSNRKAKKAAELPQDECVTTKYVYTEESRLLEDIMPVTVPKPISLLDGKNHSRSSETFLPPPSYLLKPPLASKKPPEKKVEEAAGSMSRSVSYTNPQELEQLYSNAARPFPQSSSYNLFPADAPPTEQSPPNNLGGPETLKIPKEPGEKPVSPSLYRGSKVSSTEDTPQSQSPIKEETPGSAMHEESLSLEETKAENESAVSLGAESKLAESREMLLDLLNPHKREQPAPEARRYESPIVKKVSKQAHRSHSFKEAADKQSPSRTKKQATLPASITKEEMDYYFSKDVQEELKNAKLDPVGPRSLEKEEPTSSDGGGETTKVESTEAKPTKAQEQSLNQDSGESDARNNLLNNNTDVNQNNKLLTTADEESAVPKVMENKAKFTLNEGFGKRSALDLPSPIKPTIFQNLNVAARPTKLDFAPPPLNTRVNKTPCKANTPDVIVPKDVTTPSSSETPEESTISLVKRNQEMFRQLESQNLFPNKRSSLPPKIVCDKEVSFVRARRESSAANSCQNTPCNTPSESELLSVFSKRTSQPKSEELAKLVSPMSEPRPGNQAKTEEESAQPKQFELPTKSSKLQGFTKEKEEDARKEITSKDQKPKVTEGLKDDGTKEKMKTKVPEVQKDGSNKDQKSKVLENNQKDNKMKEVAAKTTVAEPQKGLNKDPKPKVLENQKNGKMKEVAAKTTVAEPQQGLNKDPKPKVLENQKNGKMKEVTAKTTVAEPQKEGLNKDPKPKVLENQKNGKMKEEAAKTIVAEPQKEGLNKDPKPKVFENQKNGKIKEMAAKTKNAEPQKEGSNKDHKSKVLENQKDGKMKEMAAKIKVSEVQKEVQNKDHKTKVTESQQDGKNKVSEVQKETVNNKEHSKPKIVKSKTEVSVLPDQQSGSTVAGWSKEESRSGGRAASTETPEESGRLSPRSKEPLQCQRSFSLKCASEQPAWLKLAQQRREQRESTERLITGSSETAPNPKGSRSSKVLDMVNNFQKRQLT